MLLLLLPLPAPPLLLLSLNRERAEEKPAFEAAAAANAAPRRDLRAALQLERPDELAAAEMVPDDGDDDACAPTNVASWAPAPAALCLH